MNKKVNQPTIIFAVFEVETGRTINSLKKLFSNRADMPLCLQAPPYKDKHLPKNIFIEDIDSKGPSAGFYVSDFLGNCYSLMLSKMVEKWLQLQAITKDHNIDNGGHTPKNDLDLQEMLESYHILTRQLASIEKEIWKELDLYIKMEELFGRDEKSLVFRLIYYPFQYTWPKHTERD